MLCTVLLCLAAVQTESSDLAIGRVVLTDGPVWKAAASEFRMEAVLENRGSHPLTLWDPKNSEGSVCPAILLRAADGHTITLRPLGIERSGVPTVVSLAPGQTLRIMLDLVKMQAGMPLVQGTYQAQFIYRNRLSSAGPHRNVWTGEIQSSAFELTVR
jgi:hypothetical protein